MSDRCQGNDVGSLAPKLCPLFILRLANPFDRHDLFVNCRREDRDTFGRAAGNADAVDRHTDQLAAVGDEHDLVRVLDREGRHQLADLAGLGCISGADTLAAATGNTEVIGRRALAETLFGYGKYELLARLEFLVALLAEFALLGDLLADQCDVVFVDAHRATFGGRPLEIGGALRCLGVDMTENGHRNQAITVGK